MKYKDMNKKIKKIQKSCFEREEEISERIYKKIKEEKVSGSRLDEMILEEIENNMSFSEDWQKYYSKERIKEGIRKKNSKLLPTTRKRRFLNLILDYIGIFIFSLALGFILGITGLFITLEIEHMNEWLLGIIITILYYIIFESIWSKTPAKFITKTKIITEDGEKPDYKTIFIRTLIRFVPFEIFSFLGTERPRGWHDEWSKTIVVNDMPIKKVIKSQKLEFSEVENQKVTSKQKIFYCVGCGNKINKGELLLISITKSLVS